MIKMRSYRPILCASVAAISLVAASAAYAAPEGGAVSRGSATISQNGKKTDIHQSSNKVILDWRSFDIGADEHTEFHQPSRSAIALNRINDTKASKIDGRLTANGNIMLINPNGVVFGKGAQVDVGSLTATTANIDNDDFMAGKMDFKHAGNADAYIVNQGNISVKEAGLVNFVAPKVVNDGVIVAKLGKVQLAATDTFTLDMAGDGLIQVAVDATETQKIARNSGAITAEGGYVAVTAAKARGLIDSLVENTGVIAATSMTNKGGEVILGGADTGITVNDGAIDVSGRKNGAQGGEAAVLGQHIILGANSFIDASGTASAPVSAKRTDTATMTADKKVKTEEEFLADSNRGGGSIKIGGDYLGTGDTARAQAVYVDAQALTLNDATRYGDGGRTIFWSDDTTDFSGLVYARGGADGGHGGFLETSGKMNLLADGFADLSAGTDLFRKGTYLLDPNNIAIYGNVDPRFVSTGGEINLNAHLQLWLDASDASTMTVDGSGRVSAWRDKSNNAYIATPPTVGDQPFLTTVASMNNLGVIYFNGGDDHFTLGSNYIFSTNSGLVIGGAMQSIVNTGFSQFVYNFGNNGTGHYGLSYSTTDAALRGPTSHGGVSALSGAHATNAASVVLGEFVFGASHDMYINGALAASQASTGLTALGAAQIDENSTAIAGAGPVTIGTQSKSTTQASRGLNGYLGELYVYNDTLTADEKAIINQYESAKWNLALDPKVTTSDSEAVEAMASDGFSVFAASYLERLSQTADIVLQATNNITIDLMGDTLSLDNNRSISLTTTSGDIQTASAGMIEIHGTGGITFAAGRDILLSHDLNLNAQGSGNISLTAVRHIANTGGADISANGGNVTLRSDLLDLTSGTVSSASGNVIIRPYAANTSIGLGGGAGDLNLTDSELSAFNGTGRLIIGDSVAGEGDVIIDSWNLSGKSYSVEIYGNDITFQDTDATPGVDYAVNMGTGSFLAHAMDKTGDTGVLTADAMIRRNASGTATLDLRADQNIIFTAGSGLSSLTGLVNTILNADRDGDHDGAISLASANFTTNGGYFVAGGGSGTVDSDNNGILGDGGTGADNVAAWGNASYIDGVKLDFTNVTTGDGSIYIAGRGFDDAPSNDHRGVLLNEADMRTENGSIYIKGTGGYGVNGNNGVRLHYGEIVSNGSGDIIIEAHSGDTSLPVWGFYNAGFSTDNGLIETHGGLIDIKGYADVTGGRSYNDGVSLYGTRVINSSGGNISIYGERYAVTNPENYGISISGNSNVTTDGDILLETATTPLYDVFVQNSTLRTTGSGNILASIDSLDLDTGGVIDSANDVIITPRTAGASITLGGTTGSVANFSDVSLSRITADRLIIGHSAGGNGDVIIDSWDLSGRSYDVEVYGNDITFQDTDATLGVDYAVNMGTGDFLAYAGDNGDMAINAAINRGVSGTSVLDLRADNNLTFGNSGNVAATTGAIDLIASANYDGAGGGAVTFNASSIDTNGGDIDVNGAVSVGADATWNAHGGTIATDNNITLGANDLTMIADNVTIGGNITGGAGSVLTLKPYQNNRSIGLGGGAGDFNLTDAELAGLNVGRLIIGDAALGTGDVTINSWSLSGKSYDAELYGNNFTIAGMTLGGGNVTIGAGNDVSVTSAIGNSGAGGDIYINVGNDFTNSAGANGINAGTGGRFLIYADAVSNVVRGGITRGNLFNRTFAGDDPSTIDASFGSRFIFNEQPTLTVRANDVTLAYYDPAYNSFSYSVSGLVTGDTAPSALSGTPAYVTSQLNATDYSITPSMGTLASTLGYLITFQDGLLVMADNSGPTTPPTPPAPHNPPSLPGIPPSVEQQIQPPGLIAGSGYGVFPPMPGGIYGGDMAQISYDMAARKTALIRVNTSDSDAFLRMASGGYVIVDNPVAMYYDLCPYNASYCN